MYDAIVVGARCAGAPTAMLLARRGHRVLLVDRGRFPSDTLSTHFLHPPSLARLARWGVLPSATAGCPVWRGARLDLGEIVLAGIPTPFEGVDASCAPRRTILDTALVDAALRAGAELREGFSVHGLVFRDGAVIGVRGASAGRREVVERARLVIGADGLGSRVAADVGARRYVDRPARTCAYYGYWSGPAVSETRLWFRPGLAVFAFPTAGGLTVVYAAWPHERFDAVRGDLEREFLAAVDRASPELGELIRGGRREEPLRGTGRLPNHFRVSAGPGWALVGDAGHHEDPLLAKGIGNALHGAELLAEAADDGLAGRRPMERALLDYQARRDAAFLPAFELGHELAALRPPPEPLRSFLTALIHDADARTRFFGVLAGTVPVADVLHPERMLEVIERARGAAQASAAASSALEATESLA